MTAPAPAPAPTRDPLFASLTGVLALIVLLQGVFAGVFLEHDGERDASGSWIDAHAMGAHIGTVLALLVAIYAAVRLRSRRDLLIGSVVLFVLFAVESYLGGAIRDDGKDNLTVVHVPLALAIMGLAVWLPLRSRR